ncbi:FkbM family methyltransferase [Patescibacteria group bacterium]|nr:FkbM family methyltransferase [Patescibacteria group bacterium]MBU1889972.1 FkbM family methyltransferase [Patescibacteria group bacterium]
MWNNNRPEIIKEILKDSPIDFIDVGTSGGITDLSGLSDLMICQGFEPNINEISKLENKQTNQSYLKKRGVKKLPNYKSKKFYPYALSSKDGHGTLYITRSQGTSSMLKPNTEVLKNLRQNAWINGFEVIKEEKVKTVTLDTFFNKNNLTHIDFIKLDTQGTEYDILKCSKTIENNVSVIKTEAEIVQLYENQGLLHDISNLLYEKGYSLINLDLKPLFHLKNTFPKSYNRLGWVDAIFIRELKNWNCKEQLTLFKQAIIIAELGFVDLSGYLLKNINIIKESDKYEIIKYYGNYPHTSIKKRLMIKTAKYFNNKLFSFFKKF